MTYRTGVAAIANKLASTNVGSAVLMPGIGLFTGWSYVAMFTGIPDNMATMMDTVRSESLGVALGKARQGKAKQSKAGELFDLRDRSAPLLSYDSYAKLTSTIRLNKMS